MFLEASACRRNQRLALVTLLIALISLGLRVVDVGAYGGDFLMRASTVTVGVLMVSCVPGLALFSAAHPTGMSIVERSVACVGFSLGFATCVSVALAATPFGLTRGSLTSALATMTMFTSVVALIRPLVESTRPEGRHRRS